MIPKFRAWDKKDKAIRDVTHIIYMYESVVLNVERTFYERTFCEIELMQLTGLKDKNGTEIYEGDIVRYNRGVSYSVEKFPYSVKYIEGAFVFEHGFIQHNLFKNVKYVTVIGNIYENPELLEDN